jgi:hypothetical protein
MSPDSKMAVEQFQIKNRLIPAGMLDIEDVAGRGRNAH